MLLFSHYLITVLITIESLGSVNCENVIIPFVHSRNLQILLYEWLPTMVLLSTFAEHFAVECAF